MSEDEHKQNNEPKETLDFSIDDTIDVMTFMHPASWYTYRNIGNVDTYNDLIKQNDSRMLPDGKSLSLFSNTRNSKELCDPNNWINLKASSYDDTDDTNNDLWITKKTAHNLRHYLDDTMNEYAFTNMGWEHHNKDYIHGMQNCDGDVEKYAKQKFDRVEEAEKWANSQKVARTLSSYCTTDQGIVHIYFILMN